MAAYYNEIEPFAVAWLRELIKAGHIADGEVDERSIEDVRPVDLRGFKQCHFFAGIGVWSYALRLAGWPDDEPVWTASCPCQPFSSSGKREGFDDERHLWPSLYWLLRNERPSTIFGEQVADGDGLAWIDLVQADLDAENYSLQAIDLCAAGFGAPHRRQRLFWCADSMRDGDRPEPSRSSRTQEATESSFGKASRVITRIGADSSVVHNSSKSKRIGRRSRRIDRRGDEGFIGGNPPIGAQGSAEPQARGDALQRTADTASVGLEGIPRSQPRSGSDERTTSEEERRMCEFGGTRSPIRHGWDSDNGERPIVLGGWEQRFQPIDSGFVPPGLTKGFWKDAAWLFCRDGKYRPTQPGLFPLAYGAPARMGRLRGYGNAISPWVAKEFIEAYIEEKGDRLA